jgi:hypothetical protein
MTGNENLFSNCYLDRDSNPVELKYDSSIKIIFKPISNRNHFPLSRNWLHLATQLFIYLLWLMVSEVDQVHLLPHQVWQ